MFAYEFLFVLFLSAAHVPVRAASSCCRAVPGVEERREAPPVQQKDDVDELGDGDLSRRDALEEGRLA